MYKMSNHKWCELDINLLNICGVCLENFVNISLPKLNPLFTFNK